MTLYPSVTCTEMLLITARRMFIEIVSGISWPLSPLADNVSLKRSKRKKNRSAPSCHSLMYSNSFTHKCESICILQKKKIYRLCYKFSCVLSSLPPFLSITSFHRLKGSSQKVLDESNIFSKYILWMN